MKPLSNSIGYLELPCSYKAGIFIVSSREKRDLEMGIEGVPGLGTTSLICGAARGVREQPTANGPFCVSALEEALVLPRALK
jgi:hypothetical protein